MNSTCEFYFWLNVSSILYNEELKKVTDARNKKRNALSNNLDPDINFKLLQATQNQQAKEDYEAPIHFEEFEEVDEEKLKTE